jgi:hypothetical protein
LSVAFEEAGRELFLPAVNLSESGVFLASETSPPIGTGASVVLSLPPDGVFLRLRGTVVREAGPREPRGFALSFYGVDGRAAGLLRKFVIEAGAI